MDKIVEIFISNVRNKIDNRIKKVYLFGSRARGDFTNSSDYDFLFIVDRKDKNLENIIVDETVFILDNYSELVNAIVYDEKEWEFKKHIPLGMNVLKEGIIL